MSPNRFTTVSLFLHMISNDIDTIHFSFFLYKVTYVINMWVLNNISIPFLFTILSPPAVTTRCNCNPRLVPPTGHHHNQLPVCMSRRNSLGIVTAKLTTVRLQIWYNGVEKYLPLHHLLNYNNKSEKESEDHIYT